MPSAALDHDLWIRSYHRAEDGAVRLFCFPHAGGSASYFRLLSERLAPDVAVLAVQYPGRQDRRTEPCPESIEALAQSVAEVLGDLLERPYAFFGHSMGAVVAYETARLLRWSAAPEPVRFIASGRRSPTRFRPSENVHLRSDDGVIEAIRVLGGTPDELLLDPEFRQLALGPTRSDYRAVETYAPALGFRLRCPVTVLTGDRDPHTTAEEAAAWAEVAAGDCDVRVFPGGHFFLDEQRGAVAAAVRAALDGARGADR